MTGTPIQNSMQELFALLSVIDKNKFPLDKLDRFIKKYSKTDDDGGKLLSLFVNRSPLKIDIIGETMN